MGTDSARRAVPQCGGCMGHRCRIEIRRVVLACLLADTGGHHLQSCSKTSACHLPPMARALRQQHARPRVCTSMRVFFALIGHYMVPKQDFCGQQHDLSEIITAGCVRLEPRERLLPKISLLLRSTLSLDLQPPAL